MRRVILLLADGLRPDVAEERLAAGDLPSLAAMVERGAVARAVTVFPSTTNVAYFPFLTGCTPGRCNVPASRWLDRWEYRGRPWADREAVRSYCGYQSGRLDEDCSPDLPTIFQLVPESIGLFTPISRGLTPERDPSQRQRKFWGALAHLVVPLHQHADDVVAGYLLHEVEGEWRFIFAQFPAVDGLSHFFGVSAPPVLRALRKLDDVVGRLRQRLAANGKLDNTLILLVSDHGAASVHTHVDLADWFRARGVPTLAHPILWTRRPQAAVMVSGNGAATIYARPGKPRRERWPLARLRSPGCFGVHEDLVGALTAEPAVALIAAESGDGGVRLVSRDGEAEVRRFGGEVSYLPLTADPLQVGGRLLCSERDWLEATWQAHFPDAAVQLLDQFRASRTGDLVVVANEGFDFRQRYEMPAHRAGHGSLVRSHMQIPLWSSAPLPVAPLRSVDLFPWMLTWLGVPVPHGIDGQLAGQPAFAGHSLPAFS
jgi:Type I phosphodiesterase / nucleotide pyrophosphatase